jgi:16S rRNA (adenine1518-N6/adenine1519-N6)-dimethyltransferase
MLKKKSLGQNFLKAPHYLQAVANAADIKAGENILEVGPGEGALTAELLARGARVLAIEKDSRLIPILKERFKDYDISKFILIEGDALQLDISSHFKKNEPYKIVANIPYYITGALLKKLFSEKNPPSMLVLLVQKEVAERIARSTKESILSLSIQAYGTPKYVKTVPRGAFSPPPTVDSAILKIEHVSRKNFNPSTSLRTSSELEERFFTLVKAGFAQKRKLLKRNLERVLGKQAPEAMQKAGIPENARAEDVPLAQWLSLAQN